MVDYGRQIQLDESVVLYNFDNCNDWEFGKQNKKDISCNEWTTKLMIHQEVAVHYNRVIGLENIFGNICQAKRVNNECW